MHLAIFSEYVEKPALQKAEIEWKRLSKIFPSPLLRGKRIKKPINSIIRVYIKILNTRSLTGMPFKKLCVLLVITLKEMGTSPLKTRIK